MSVTGTQTGVARAEVVVFLTRWMHVALPVLVAAPLAAQDIGFEGPSFTGAGATPTESKPENKLWFNDGIWWGALWSSSAGAFRIHRLNFATHAWVDTGVAIEGRPNSHSDVLWDGTNLYIASHQFATAGSSGNPILILRYSYNSSSDSYSRDEGFPVTIGDFSTEALVIDKDSTGTVWAAWTQSSRVRISHTLASDTQWSSSVVLPTNTTNLAPDDICSLTAFNGRIGVLWSDQVANAYRFSFHVDGAADTAWSAVENVSTAETDDHLNLAVDSTGRVYLAGKNAANNLLLFVRAPAGGWSRFVITQPSPILTRPIVLLNEQAGTIHVFATGQDTGEVFEKTSPTSNISFGAGTGTIRMRDASTVFRISNPTSTKQNFDASTGLVVLAHHDTTSMYWRHEVAPVVAAPVANFGAAPTSGTAPLSVNFTDASSGSITSRSWNFGDGGTSSSTNPSHTYASAGTFTVSLTATGPGGSDTETKTNLITVSPASGAPVANFSAAPTSGQSPLFVSFTDASSGSIASRSWNFGDGFSSTATNPSHPYAAGTYTVTLTVSGPGGSDTETKTNLITVSPAPGAPVANFTASPTSGQTPLQVQFTDTSTGNVTSRSWSFGDGGTSTATNPTHTFSSGTFTVVLTVFGPNGPDRETKFDFITASPPSGQPVLGAPTPGVAGEANTLTVTGVTPGGLIGFYTSQTLGSSTLSRPGCPGGIPMGLRSPPTLLGTRHANSSGVATLTFTPAASQAGKLFHFQAVDQAACEASNIVSDRL